MVDQQSVEESVVLVDDHDVALGIMGKLEAHITGTLHRAVSVFIFNSRGEFLLQQRAAEKYHSAGKWSNTCCSHPRPNESNADAARRRLQEEMGMDCDLQEWFNFTYHAEFDNGLIEHEYDHVFIGQCDELPIPNPLEVSGFKYIDPQSLNLAINQNPDDYTEWFKLCLQQINQSKNADSL